MALPRSGNDDAILRDHLRKFVVLQVLLLHGSYEYSQDEVGAMLKRIGVDVPVEFIPRLYFLALDEAKKAALK